MPKLIEALLVSLAKSSLKIYTLNQIRCGIVALAQSWYGMMEVGNERKGREANSKVIIKAALCPFLSRGEEKETDFGDGRKSKFKS